MTVSMPGLTRAQAVGGRRGPVAGLDEAGRRRAAVVAAAVILPDRDDLPDVLAGVRDSKLCTPRQRRRSTRWCWRRRWRQPSAWPPRGGRGTTSSARHSLPCGALDGLGVEVGSCSSTGARCACGSGQRAAVQQTRVSGIRSIAAASILAKVTRDRILIELDEVYPSTALRSTRVMDEAAPCGAGRVWPWIHRRTYAPIRGSLLDAIPGADDSSEGA